MIRYEHHRRLALSSNHRVHKLRSLPSNSSFGSELVGLHFTSFSIAFLSCARCDFLNFLLINSFDFLMFCWQGVEQFVLLADASDRVPTLRNKSYSDFQLMKRDWDKLEVIRAVLRVQWTRQLEF
jgi:hypothetical protein